MLIVGMSPQIDGISRAESFCYSSCYKNPSSLNKKSRNSPRPPPPPPLPPQLLVVMGHWVRLSVIAFVLGHFAFLIDEKNLLFLRRI